MTLKTLSTSVWIAAPDDLAELASLFRDLREWRGPETASAVDQEPAVEAMLSDPGYEFLLARSEEWLEPSGLCLLHFTESGGRRSAWACRVEEIYVPSHLRGRGVGRALLEGALARARARYCRLVESRAPLDSERAVRLHEQLGFRYRRLDDREVLCCLLTEEVSPSG